MLTALQMALYTQCTKGLPPPIAAKVEACLHKPAATKQQQAVADAAKRHVLLLLLQHHTAGLFAADDAPQTQVTTKTQKRRIAAHLNAAVLAVLILRYPEHVPLGAFNTNMLYAGFSRLAQALGRHSTDSTGVPLRFEAQHWRSRDSHGGLEWGSCNICVHRSALCKTINNVPNPIVTQPAQRLRARYKRKPQTQKRLSRATSRIGPLPL